MIAAVIVLLDDGFDMVLRSERLRLSRAMLFHAGAKASPGASLAIGRKRSLELGKNLLVGGTVRRQRQ